MNRLDRIKERAKAETQERREIGRRAATVRAMLPDYGKEFFNGERFGYE